MAASTWTWVWRVVMIGAAINSVAVASQGTGPSFDCAKATSATEKIICGDAGLSALDRQLASVYNAAVAKAKDGPARALPAEQRGWVKGRNECVRAQAGSPVLLTESWTSDNTRDCIEAQYRLRIAELQALWLLVPAEGPVFYRCAGSPANELV